MYGRLLDNRKPPQPVDTGRAFRHRQESIMEKYARTEHLTALSEADSIRALCSVVVCLSVCPSVLLNV